MPITVHIHKPLLQMRHIFTTAHGERKNIEGFVLELRDGLRKGFGEATPVPYYGISTQQMEKAILGIKSAIETYDYSSPPIFWQKVHTHFQDNHFALCALDIALHDLWAKKQNKPLYRCWGLYRKKKLPLSNYTIGIDSIEVMLRKMQEMPFPIYKIKLGTPDDVTIVQTLRKHTKALFRVDANAAWTVEESIENAKKMKPLGVEFIEQPMQMHAYEAMKEVKKYSVLPLIADESCILEADVEKCRDSFHGVNIKLAKCGGFTPALRMIAQARKLHLKVMCGCMTESSIGISAIAQLLPMLDYVDMDGALLVANDPADGVSLDFGKAIYPNRNGIGAVWKG